MHGSGLLEEVRRRQVSGGGGHVLIFDLLLFFQNSPLLITKCLFACHFFWKISNVSA